MKSLILTFVALTTLSAFAQPAPDEKKAEPLAPPAATEQAPVQSTVTVQPAAIDGCKAPAPPAPKPPEKEEKSLWNGFIPLPTLNIQGF